MNYQVIIEKVVEGLHDYEDKGSVATYIHELAKVDPDKFGVHLVTVDNAHYSYGNNNEKFSIQSIAKVFTFALAYKNFGEKIWKRVGVEPSGTPFNSLVQLEYDKGIPRNPFINAGAIVICDILLSLLKDPHKEFLDFVKRVSVSNEINYCKTIAESERSTGYRNAALVNLMKSFQNIENDIDDVLNFYFDICSIKMTCEELAESFLFLASEGLHPITNEEILTLSQSKRINAIMQTCGFYDESGEFTYRVGLPGKSGVGGGIAALHPKKYSIAVWSPRLNKKGNSSKGITFLENFTSETELSIF